MQKCIVGKISLKPHPTRSDLKIGNIAGRTVVVGDHYDPDTLGFFIPDGAIIPDKLADEMWVRGKLAGSQKNRVKARMVAGEPSDGLFYGSCYWLKQGEQFVEIASPSWNPQWQEGDDVTEQVGITFAV